MWSYFVEFKPDDNGTILITCPDLPSVVTCCNTLAELKDTAQHAIEAMIEAYIADNEYIIVPSDTFYVDNATIFFTRISLSSSCEKKARKHNAMFERPYQ